MHHAEGPSFIDIIQLSTQKHFLKLDADASQVIEINSQPIDYCCAGILFGVKH
jgi:hypothetical protein